MDRRGVNPLSDASWQGAREAAAMVVGVLAPEQAPVHLSPGRVLAMNCVALCDLPSFDSSAMDGWAVAGAGPWEIVGDARAGSPLAKPLVPGTAARIATGAVVPTGTGAVIRWEDARVTEGLVNADPAPGSHIRRAGEECRTGDLIARVGTRVTPALAGFLAATGHDHVAVVRRPRIHVLLLGDELQQAGIPSGGRVRDSLGPQLPGWLSRMGAEVVAGDLVADDLAEVASAIGEAVGKCDLIITTGGTAAGSRDHLRAAIGFHAGTVLVDCVAVRPGHPMLLAEVAVPDGRRVPVVGLPGNPHSAIVGLLTLAEPLVDAMLGRPKTPLAMVATASELRAPRDHTRLIAGNLVEGRFELSPYGGSAMLRGLAQSSGFAVVPEGTTPEGAHIQWLPLP